MPTGGDRDTARLELTAAIQASDATVARHLLAGWPAERQGEVLDLLGGLAAAGEGTGLATELLIEQLDSCGVVERFVRTALLDEAAVDDVVQDSLISVAGSIHSYRGSSKVTTWVHRIVRNRVVDHLRRQRATSPLPPDDIGPAERMSSMIATRSTVRDALADLPDLYRAPVTLRDLHGLAYADIAERLDRSVGTVKSQVSRGRALVAAALRGTGGSEGAR